MVKTNNRLDDSLDQILIGCRAGERPAQARLYRLLSHRMMGVCLWYARSKEEAEEILQDGFVRVFTYLHQYNGSGSFEGWVRKIMVNAALFKYRNKSSGMYAITTSYEDKYDTAEDADFITRYDEKVLLGLIQKLSPIYRMVFNLYVFEGFKHKEIAGMLNISEGTSKSNLSDARRILRGALQSKQQLASS